MKKLLKISLLFIISVLLCFSFTYSQLKTSSNLNNLHTAKQIRQIINEQNVLQAEIYKLHKINTPGALKKLRTVEFQSAALKVRKDAILKNSNTNYKSFAGKGDESIKKVAVGDRSIIESNSHGYDSFATATEIRGPHKGRIWVAYSTEASTSTDSIVFYYSDDGALWHYYAWAKFQGYLCYTDEMDLAVVDPDSGDSYLWCSAGIYTTNKGILKCGIISIDVTNFNEGENILSWPGASPYDNYYCPRIATDNSYYTKKPYVFIVCSIDSSVNGSKYLYGQKLAVIHDPLTVDITSSLQYYPSLLPVYWPAGGTTEYEFLYSDLTCEVQLPDSIETVMISYSNVPDSTHIWLTKYIVNGQATFLGTVGSGTKYISQSEIASPIVGNQLMIACLASDNNNNSIITYKSTDAGTTWKENVLFNTITSNTYYPAYFDLISRPDISNNYHIIYTIDTALTGVFFPIVSGIIYKSSLNTNSNNWNSGYSVTSLFSSDTTYNYYARAGYSIGKSQNNFALINASSSSNIYLISQYNFGEITSVKGQNIFVSNFNLQQNYPNPFNPSTEINYNIPKAGIVKLSVYNSLGQKLAVLVNKYQQAGKHTVNFNAKNLASGIYFYRLQSGSFIQAKKMILLK